MLCLQKLKGLALIFPILQTVVTTLVQGKVGTAIDPAQLIPSLGGFMVLGDVRNLCLLYRIRKHSHLDRLVCGGMD